MKRLLSVIVMLVVGFSTMSALAGVKTIKPYDLKPRQSDVAYNIWPSYVSAVLDPVTFYAVVKIPAGKVVKNLTYYHRGLDVSAVTSVYLFRHIIGEDPQLMCSAIGTGTNTPISALPFEDEGVIHNAKIKRGYTYYIEVYSHNSSSQIEGIQITYK